MNLTDNEIKKALECCTKGNTSDVCVDCPLRTTDICTEEENGVLKLALDYINRLEAENGRLQAEIERITDNFNCQQTVYADLSKIIKEQARKLKTARTEAVKEFAVRLKDFSRRMYPLFDEPIIDWKDIDNLVKEMAGEG